jgi:hypothetical protein
MSSEEYSDIRQRLERIEQTLTNLEKRQTVKEHYSLEEAARILGKAPFTVREWARHGRIHAGKKAHGRGRTKEWVISHQELERIQREGLLPLRLIA